MAEEFPKPINYSGYLRDAFWQYPEEVEKLESIVQQTLSGDFNLLKINQAGGLISDIADNFPVWGNRVKEGYWLRLCEESAKKYLGDSLLEASVDVRTEKIIVSTALITIAISKARIALAEDKSRDPKEVYEEIQRELCNDLDYIKGK